MDYKEAFKLLGEPVPQDQIKRLPSGANYTTDKFVQDRLDAVVGPENWFGAPINIVLYNKPLQKLNKQGEVTNTFVGIMVYSLTVLGVTKVDATDLEYDDLMYGSPSTNAVAAAFKRAARLHNVARELWKGTDASVSAGTYTAPRSNATPSSRASGEVERSTVDKRNFFEPKGGTLKFLLDLHVPEPIALGLNSNGTRENPSQASQIIMSLRQARDEDYQGYNGDPDPFIHDALAMYAPDLLTANHAPVPVAAVAAPPRPTSRRIRPEDEEDDE